MNTLIEIIGHRDRVTGEAATLLLHQLYFYLPLTVSNEVVKPSSFKDFIQ